MSGDPKVSEQTVGGTRHAGTVPRVSIVIPSYNHERFVARAIESVLSQTYQDFEIVITDDASTDGSVDVLSTYTRKDPRIKLFLNRFNYETHATNHCIQHSSGEYVAVLSSDDEFFPTKLERQVDFPRSASRSCRRLHPGPHRRRTGTRLPGTVSLLLHHLPATQPFPLRVAPALLFQWQLPLPSIGADSSFGVRHARLVQPAHGRLGRPGHVGAQSVCITRFTSFRTPS